MLRLVPRLVGLLFVYAAISKLMYPTPATAALESLGLRSIWADAIVFSVTGFELYLGMILLMHRDLKWGLSASMALMFLFVVFMWYLSMTSEPPSCGCLGLAKVFTSTKQEAYFGLLRNCVILWALKWSYDCYFKRTDAKEVDATLTLEGLD